MSLIESRVDCGVGASGSLAAAAASKGGQGAHGTQRVSGPTGLQNHGETISAESCFANVHVASAATRPLHVAVLDEELPVPPNSGKRIRTLNLLVRLAPRHHITFVSYRNADAGETGPAQAHLRACGITAVSIDRRMPRKSGPEFYGRLLWNLGFRLPYSVQVHTSRRLRNALRRHAGEHPVNLWHCEWTPYAESLRGLNAAPHLIIAHNVESLIWQRYFETESHWLKRWYIHRQWEKFERFERAVFSEAAKVVTVSEQDALLARQRYAARCLDVVENGVDVLGFRPGDAPRDANRILFLGSLDWRPNLDALQVLLDYVFPRVVAAEPSARLTIVGRRAPTWLQDRVNRQPGAELHSDVRDVRPFLHRSGVMAVPLRIGGGSRLKILEALAAECPVVSTQVGAEGLRLIAGRHFLQADRPDEMVQAILTSIRYSESVRAMARCGREIVAQHYDWDILAEKLDSIWRATVNSRSHEDGALQ